MSRWHEDCLRRCEDCTATTTNCTHRQHTHEDSYKRFMTIGSVRYGMRVGAVSPPPPGAGPRYRTHCCWSASPCSDISGSDTGFAVSRIPLLSTPPINSLDIISCANKMRMNEDAMSTSEQTLAQQPSRDHVLYPDKCFVKTQLKRCALVRPQVYTRLVEYGEINGNKEDNTLDRLPRFRFGGNRAERLKRGVAPIPPPRTRHPSRTTPPVSPQPVPTSTSSQDNEEYNNTRITPLRSASFSQVDYCTDDNKYVRRRPVSGDDEKETHFSVTTLPRSKTVSRTSVNPETTFVPIKPEPSISNNINRLSSEENSSDVFLSKDIPEVEITPESPEQSPEKSLERTPVRTHDNTKSSQDKRRDKSRRRKGIYLPRWPSGYNSADDVVQGCENANQTTPQSFVWSSPQEEPISPEDNNYVPEWPLKHNLSLRFQSQSPEEKDSVKISKHLSAFRSDSLSEGEPEFSERKSDQISLAPSDISDTESRVSVNTEPTSPNIPRRYSKRPLRGPYGQMLEAEMKKPEARKNLNSDLKFLEDLSLTSGSVNNLSRSRGSCNSSIDETNKENGKVNINFPKPQSVPKRKVSADNLVIENEQKLIANHQRTTSSPSKLEVFTNTEVSSELLEQLLRGSSEQLAANDVSQQQQNDTRTHVLIELYDNERSYVESLQIICKNYWEPLKKSENQCLLETNLVEEIFSQIPVLLNHHQRFLQQLKIRLEHWDGRQIIGDVFLEMFSQAEVIDNYTTYVNNWKRSRDILKNAQQSKPSFNRFLEVTARQHAGKLALDSLLIKPIQKFPKYELLLQRLIKHTNETHPDYELLLEAQKQVHEHLLKINCTEKEALDMEQLRELENLIEGAMDLASPERQYIRHDMVIMSHGGSPKKERALFLFSDLLLITGIKRRSGTINKKSTAATSTANTSLDANKYKLMMKVPLEDVEIIRSKDENLRQLQIELDNLNEDISVLNQINELSKNLHCSHSQLDDIVKDMLTSLNKQLLEPQNNDLQLSVLDLTVLTQNGIENVSIIFPKPEARSSWEECLTESKARLILTGDRRPCPEMIATVPIRKTRAGLQFTCAAPTLSENGRDVWVCNSDGYVGQVCILTLGDKPEPTVTSCNGVCNTRILCIASVPGPGLAKRMSAASSSSRNKDKMQQQKVMQFDSSSSSDENEIEEEPPKNIELETGNLNNEEPDKFSTMWLGTEDGCIHIYNSNDNIRTKKNKSKLQLGSAVLSIIYLENRVFTSQANGTMLVYDRDNKTGWNTNSPKTINIGNSSTPVSKMVVYNSKIFCSCGNTIIILNPYTLEGENSFTVTTDSNKPISCMLLFGNSLWLSLQNSAIIKCYHAITFEFMCEANVAPAVTKMLTSCDDIIRQHKAACLRVTALVNCKDLLWIGTSAGVLLTMHVPHISASTSRLSNVPTVTGVPQGHTGHVRILTSVEMAFPTTKKGTPFKKSSKGKTTEQPKPVKYLVISGGDGFEDFRTSNLSEVAGREDSTNHLVLWSI